MQPKSEPRLRPLRFEYHKWEQLAILSDNIPADLIISSLLLPLGLPMFTGSAPPICMKLTTHRVNFWGPTDRFIVRGLPGCFRLKLADASNHVWLVRPVIR